MTDAFRGCGCHAFPSPTVHCLASIGCDRPHSVSAKPASLPALALAVNPINHVLLVAKMRHLESSPRFEYTVLPLSLSSVYMLTLSALGPVAPETSIGKMS